MVIIAFCNTIQNPVSIEDVKDDERRLNTYFLTENDDESKRIYYIPVLKGTKHFRRKSNTTRSEYNSGGGEMTKIHILVELKAYTRAKTSFFPIIIDDQECPLRKMGICTTPCSKYIAKAPEHAFDLLDYYPNVEFEPGRNLTSRCRSDVKLTSADRQKEAAIEVENTSPDTANKLSLGYPILVLPAKKKQDIEYVLSATEFDTRKDRCSIENGWALPFMINQFGCSDVCERFRLSHCIKKVNKTRQEQNHDEGDGAIKHYKHGMFPETKLERGKFAGEPLDYVMDVERENVIEWRKKNPTLYVLTPYARQLYNLEATDLEIQMDKCIDELDRVVDVGIYTGKTVEEVAQKDFSQIIWLQNDCRNWKNNRLSQDCMNFLSRMYCRKKK